MKSKIIAGIDGCKGGWVCALRHTDSAAIEICRLIRLDEILAQRPRPVVIAIDMPMGLLDGARRGGRACEVAARLAMPGKSSSVFSAPCRGALAATTYAQALRLNRASGPDHVGLSKQAFHLLPKLRELDGLITPARQKRIVEAHPELAFARLNGGTPVLAPKRRPEGRAARIELLRKAGVDPAPALAALPRKLAAADDILDALVLTLTAQRRLEGNHTMLEDRARDARGLKMAICF